MASVLPFRAFLPKQQFACDFPSRSVDTFSAAALTEYILHHPQSFLSLIKNAQIGDQKERIRELFFEWVEKGILQQSETGFYLYTQLAGNASHTGIIALASVVDFQQGNIRKHEETLEARENLLADYLFEVKLNAEPVCLFHRHFPMLQATYQEIKAVAPTLDFTEENGTNHRLWAVTDDAHVHAIEQLFDEAGPLYIADGHHRTASSVRLHHRLLSLNAHDDLVEKSAWFMSIIFDEDQLDILPYHRLITGLTESEVLFFWEGLQESFQVQRLGAKPFLPNLASQLGMFHNGEWFSLLSIEPVHEADPAPVFFEKRVLQPLLGMHNPRTDKRLHYVHGAADPKTIETLIQTGKHQFAFTLSAVSSAELIQTADADKTLPPKSTWIEPKLLSGLTVYDLG